MYSKIVKITGLAWLAALLLAACGAAPQPKSTLKVLAAQTFLADIAQNVAGERAIVESLIPMGMDPHAFEPTPQDVKRIAESNVLILNGGGFEEWAQKMLENAGGERLVIEASAGLAMRQLSEGETPRMDDDHSVESHSAMVCEQLAGKQAEKEIQTGASAERATELPHEEYAADERAHEGEIITLKLNLQSDGTYGGFLAFNAEAEEGYVFTGGAGKITLTTQDGTTLTPEQELPLDCGSMSTGVVYQLNPGQYLVALSGFAAEKTPFSAAPIHAAEEKHSHRHEGDPHFWFDPTLVVKYVENIRDGLVAADPQGKDIYTANAAAYIVQLNELDGWINSQVEQIPAERRLLVTDHHTFGYFADRYGFTIVGVIVPSFSSGASPSAQELARLIDQIKNMDAPAIFLESSSSPQLAQQIAAESGVKVVTNLYTHSITEPEGEAPTYLDMMKHNVQVIVAALK